MHQTVIVLEATGVVLTVIHVDVFFLLLERNIRWRNQQFFVAHHLPLLQ